MADDYSLGDYGYVKSDDSKHTLLHPDGSRFNVPRSADVDAAIQSLTPVQQKMEAALPSDNFQRVPQTSGDIYTGMKVADENTNSYTLQKPDGSKFQVAKSDLGPSQIASIEGLSESDTTQDATPAGLAANQATPGGINIPGGGASGQGLVQNANYNYPLNVGQENPLLAPFTQQQKAETAIGQAQSEGQKAAAAGFDAAQKQLADIQKQAAPIYQDYKAKGDAAYQNMLTGKIDPNRWFSNLSTGGSILNALAIGLGGIGGALTHTGVNPALDLMNKYIDKDIEAQKAEMAKNKDVYEANTQGMRNIQEWEAHQRQNILSAAQVMLQKTAANTTSQTAIQEANKLNAQIEQQKQQAGFDYAMRAGQAKVLAGEGNQNDVVNFLNYPGNKEIKNLAFNEPITNPITGKPDTKISFAANPEDAKALKESLPIYQSLDDKIKDAIQFANSPKAGWLGTVGGNVHIPLVGDVGYKTDADTIAEDKRNSIVLDLNALHEKLGNRLPEHVLETYKEMVSSPGSFRKSKALAQLVELRNQLQSSRASQIENHVLGRKPIPKIDEKD